MAAWRHGQAAAQQFSVSPVSPFGAIFRSIVVQCERHGLLPDVSRSLSFCILGIAGSVSKSHRPVEYEGSGIRMSCAMASPLGIEQHGVSTIWVTWLEFCACRSAGKNTKAKA